MKNNRFSLFIKNFFAYGTVSVLNKIIPLIALPILTRLLTDTADYGRYDMYNTLLHFGESVAVLGLYDAMFREYFESEDPNFRMKTKSSALNIVILSTTLLFLFLLIFRKFVSVAFLGDSVSGNVVVLAALGISFASIRTIVSAPTRMKNKRSIYVISGVVGSLLYYLVGLGLVYLGTNYLGMIYGNLISFAALLLFFIIINWKEFKLFSIDKERAKTLLKIGIPTVPALLATWVFTSMDKIMITNMLGLAQVGIYSVGARLASVSVFVQMAFAGGWQYFAFSTMKDQDQISLMSKIFDWLSAISFSLFLVATFFDGFVFNLLFEGDYVNGAIVFPYLFLSPLLLMIYLIGDSQFMVYKKSYLTTICLLSGAGANLVLNYFFIQWYGIVGAALGTLIGYGISVTLMLIITIKNKWLTVSPRFYLSCFAILIFVAKMFFFDDIWTNIMALSFLFLIAILYRKEIKRLLEFSKKSTQKIK
jgi:O-antigen/teichoic acid export membrane protein